MALNCIMHFARSRYIDRVVIVRSSDLPSAGGGLPGQARRGSDVGSEAFSEMSDPESVDIASSIMAMRASTA